MIVDKMEKNNQDIEKNDEVVKIEYTRPKFWHRCMANFVDFFIFLVLFISLFIGARSIAQSTPSYKKIRQEYYDLQLSSGLYVKDPGDDKNNVDIIYYCNTYVGVYGREYDGKNMDDPEKAPSGRNGRVVVAINKFLDFCHENCSTERYNDLVVYYNEARLEPTYEGIHYFIEDGGEVVPNPTLATDAKKSEFYYKNVFTPFIEKKCIPFLAVNVPNYKKLSRTDYNLLLFAELPSAFLLAGILTYFIPPLFFRRGKKTLGKALYHIGLIDTKRMLSPSFWKYLLRFIIYFFGEMVLGMFTLGIPYIISFSMMAFSKNRQGFPDYMLGLYEVDTSKANIYLDYVEAQLKNELHGQAVDFKMKKPL